MPDSTSSPTPEAQRHAEYERWFRSGRVSAAIVKFALGPVGQWAINTPLMKLHTEAALRADQRWLDVGCGRGSLLRTIDGHVHFEQAPVGLDFSHAVLRQARWDALGPRRSPRFIEGSATGLPFADGTFDFITCGYMIKHLDDEELIAFLAELRRVLAGGGLALIWDYAPTGSALLDRWNRALLGAVVAEPRLRTTGSLMQAARAAGYELVRDGQLRPFIAPPIPRASIFIGKAPEGWHPEHS